MIGKIKFKLKLHLLRKLNISPYPEHIKISYSQEGEDILLWRMIESFSKTTGVYVDVGCNHPWKWSNTAFFYNQGWEGVVIDPNPEFSETFAKERPRDKFLNLGISNQSSKLTYHKFDISLYNTFLEDKANELVKRGVVSKTGQIEVSVEPLGDALQRIWPHGMAIDLLSIDAEGLDYQIIHSHNFEKFPVKYLIIETDTMDILRTAETPLVNYLRKKDFILTSKLHKSLIFFHDSEFRRLS